MTDMRAVNLPGDLCVRAEKKFEKFGDLEKLLEYVLKELLRDDAGQADEREQGIIEQRLKELGYL